MLTESYTYRQNNEFKQRAESSLVLSMDNLGKFGHTEKLRFNDPTEKAVFYELCNTRYKYDGGTKAIYDSISPLLKQQDTTREEIIRRISENESVMNAMATMWEAIKQRDIQNYPIILSVLHAQLPLSKMNGKLSSLVETFEESDYEVKPFADSRLCYKAEGYLDKALITGQVGTDGKSFLLKTTKDPNKDNVGFTIGLSTMPLKAKDQGVIVPYMWYRPTDDKDSIQDQVLSTGKFYSCHTWEVMRQFYAFDFTQTSGMSFNVLKDFVIQRDLNDEEGVSHI